MNENKWALDFTCLVLRLRQIKDLDYTDSLREHLTDRILNCDLPRMQAYLTAEMWQMIMETEQS